MSKKFNGIDERTVKCSDLSDNSIQAGLSFDTDQKQNILRFHFLRRENPKDDSSPLYQETKAMWLDRENTKQLIKKLRELKF